MLPKINSSHGSETRNIINAAIDSINAQGKSIQDLVAEGQLTPTQYAELLRNVNNLLKNGDVDKYALSESLRKELEAIKEASPKGVYENLTELRNAYPNGADGIYVVSDNGNWYFWNGSIWESGGVYQGKTLSENEIEKVAEVANVFNQAYQGLEVTHETFVNKAGDVKSGVYNPPGGFQIVRGSVSFIDNNNTFLSKRHIPKIMVFKRNSGENNFAYFITRTRTKQKVSLGFWLKKSDISNLSSGSSNAQISLQLEVEDDSLNTTYGDIRMSIEEVLTVGATKTVDVLTDKMVVKVEQEYKGWIYLSAKTTKPINKQSRIGLSFRTLNLANGNDGKIEILNFTMIDGADETLPFFVYPANSNEIAMTQRELSYKVNSIESIGISKWSGKKWTVLGDSNSNNSSLRPYHSLIAEEKNIIVSNKSVGGTGYISKGSNNDRPRISEQISLADSDSDLITVLAGVNDYSTGYPLGTIEDKTYTTFYGALNLTVDELINKFPLKTIAIITQMPRNNENIPGRASVEEQVNATIDVCRKNSIPVLDLYHAGNIYPKSSVYMEAAKTDGVHLTQLGQEKVASKISHFIETL